MKDPKGGCLVDFRLLDRGGEDGLDQPADQSQRHLQVIPNGLVGCVDVVEEREAHRQFHQLGGDPDGSDEAQGGE